MRKNLIKSIEISAHIILWGSVFIILVLYAQNLGNFKKDDGSIYIPLIYGLVSNLLIFYINALYLIPKYIPSKKINRYILWIASLFLGITFIESVLDHFIYINLYSTNEEPFVAQIILNFIINGLILSLSIGYGFIKNRLINENQKQKLIKEKLSADLNYLKAQVNPHFLFNTLNMAYAGSVKHGDIETSDIIEKLAGLMRYSLYECNDDKVELSKEINYLRNYIDLQIKRLSDDIKQHLNIRIDSKETNLKIAPLLLIPFIENVFKHGITINNPVEISIIIELDENELKLLTKNPIKPDFKSSEYSGIGIKNARTRLDLIYGKKYSLNIKNKDNLYITELNIQL